MTVGPVITLLISTVAYTRQRRKSSRSFLCGFMEDEQKAIRYIQSQKEALQKDLQREFGFSRSKATRIVKKLESKRIISKEEFGRTNKIYRKGEPADPEVLINSSLPSPLQSLYRYRSYASSLKSSRMEI